MFYNCQFSPILSFVSQMGCCISKCQPKEEDSIDEFSHVEEKLVIVSQASKAPHFPHSNKVINKVSPVPLSNKVSPSPPSPSNSTSSASSFSCTTSTATSNMASSCSSVSSASSSSVLCSKDRSFSNEFLWACYRENPHIVRINSIREASLLLSNTKATTHQSQKFDPVAAELKQRITQRPTGSTAQKRVRSSSPTRTLTRQKSFRVDPEIKVNSLYSVPSRRALRSPSPSRRFGGENGEGLSKESCSKRMVGSKVNAAPQAHSLLPSFRPASPCKNPGIVRPCLRNRETCVHRVSSKIDETAVREALSSQEDSNTDCLPMEDIDNPLISLDCFIFL